MEREEEKEGKNENERSLKETQPDRRYYNSSSECARSLAPRTEKILFFINYSAETLWLLKVLHVMQ